MYSDRHRGFPRFLSNCTGTVKIADMHGVSQVSYRDILDVLVCSAIVIGDGQFD